MKRKRERSLSEADEKTLGTLAAKYGRKLIADEVVKVALPVQGRPRREMPALAAISIEWMIEQRAEHGSRSPVEDVARIIYRQEFGGRKGDATWSKFLSNFKRNRPRARGRVRTWPELHDEAD